MSKIQTEKRHDTLPEAASSAQKYYNTGLACFGLSGICAISAGVIVSLIRDRYGFSYGLTGTMISTMSIGNMAALFFAGILPVKLGEKRTTLLMCSGYSIGYLLMGITGNPLLLMTAFLAAGIAKGCTANKCTVLVGNYTVDRARGMSVMNAYFAAGALLCPLLISAAGYLGRVFPDSVMLQPISIAAAGLVMWLALARAGLPDSVFPGQQKKSGGTNDFFRNPVFWIMTFLLFCENGAEYSVNGWMVTYYKNEHILSASLSSYAVTIQWAAMLIGRLLIAYVIRIRDMFKFLTAMGAAISLIYCVLVSVHSPAAAVIALALFSLAISGLYPLAVAGIGEMTTSESVGVMLSIAGFGGILFPWIIGMVADRFGLRIGMAVNLLPCVGTLVMSLLMCRRRRQE